MPTCKSQYKWLAVKPHFVNRYIVFIVVIFVFLWEFHRGGESRRYANVARDEAYSKPYSDAHIYISLNTHCCSFKFCQQRYHVYSSHYLCLCSNPTEETRAGGTPASGETRRISNRSVTPAFISQYRSIAFKSIFVNRYNMDVVVYVFVFVQIPQRRREPEVRGRRTRRGFFPASLRRPHVYAEQYIYFLSNNFCSSIIHSV